MPHLFNISFLLFSNVILGYLISIMNPYHLYLNLHQTILRQLNLWEGINQCLHWKKQFCLKNGMILKRMKWLIHEIKGHPVYSSLTKTDCNGIMWTHGGNVYHKITSLFSYSNFNSAIYINHILFGNILNIYIHIYIF